MLIFITIFIKTPIFRKERTLPIYEYECQDCGKTFEAFLGVKDGPVTACVHCQSTHIKKLISNCSFQLKGTGWYVTDYANKNGQANGGSKTKEKKPDSSEGTTKTESKDTSKSSENSKADKKESGKAA